MLHPTQNRPPRAQAIKNRREARASGQRFFCLGITNKALADQGGTPSMVKWSEVKAMATSQRTGKARPSPPRR